VILATIDRMSSAKTTTNHDTIKQWVEARGGCPARVKGTGSGDDPGILRIDYPGFSGVKTLEAIEWGEFFDAFEANNLAFLYQDEDKSRFSKLVSRDRAELDDEAEQGNGRASSGADAIELLESQHREVESLFQQLSEAESTREKSELFVELADNLAAHAKIEETIFYPAVCDDDTLALLRESVEEHLGIKRVIADLLALEPTDAQFMTKVEVLEELVNHHVAEEEGELFVRARELEGVDLEVLGKKMKRRFEELIESEPREQVPRETDAAASLPC
jgi:hypothetical protein